MRNERGVRIALRALRNVVHLRSAGKDPLRFHSHERKYRLLDESVIIERIVGLPRN